jgi:hypothetical protein
MFAHLTRQKTHPRAAAPTAGPRLRRPAAALAGITAALLASAVNIPAAFARDDPSGLYRRFPVAPTTVHAVTAGGITGWQIALITLAVVAAAAVTGLLARTRTVRRAAPSPTA